LEDWLHRPPGAVKVDVESVLAPYATAPNVAETESATGEGIKPLAA
jgi:hypothetical protein